MASSEVQASTVILRDGFVTSPALVTRVIDIEAKGCRFEPHEAGGFRVTPPSLLTSEDREFLRANRDEVRRVIDYCDRIAQKPL